MGKRKGIRTNNHFKPPKIKRSSKSVMQRSIALYKDEINSFSSVPVANEQSRSLPLIDNDDYDDDHGADQYEGETHEYMATDNHPLYPTNSSSRPVSLSTRAERNEADWAKLFPELWKAYLRGLGIHPVDNTKLDLVQTRRCNCEIMDTNKITCVFKCG